VLSRSTLHLTIHTNRLRGSWRHLLRRLSSVAESVTPVQRRYLLHGLILGIALSTAIAAIGE
jgi:hypothetical protein